MTDVRVSQVAVEVIRTNNAPNVRLSQLAVEVLRPNATVLKTAESTDTTAVTDSLTASWAIASAPSDSAALSASAEVAILQTASASDAVDVSDIGVTTLVTSSSPSDNVTLGVVVEPAFTVATTVVDAITTTDSGSAVKISDSALSDSASLAVVADAEVIAAPTGATYEETCTDAIATTDSGSAVRVSGATLSDSAGMSAVASAAWVGGAVLSDSTSLSVVADATIAVPTTYEEVCTDALLAADYALIPRLVDATDRMNLWGTADHQDSPSLEGGDPRWPYLEFLFHCDNTAGLNTLADSGPYTYNQTLSGYATNNALIDTTTKKYGDGSLRLTGAVTAGAPYDALGGVPPISVTPPLGTGDFTFEFFVRPVDYGFPGGSAGSANTMFYIGDGSWAGDYIMFLQWYSLETTLDVYRYDGGSWPGTSVTVPAFEPAIWYHVALTKQGDDYTVYVDGAVAGTATLAGLDLSDSTVIIGNEPDLTKFGYNGRFDEIRLSRMVRYVEPFTAPTEAFLGISPAMAAAAYSLMSSFAFTDAVTYDMTYSRTAAAQMSLSRSVAVQLFFKPSMVDGVITRERIASSWPMQLAESLGVTPATVISRAHRVVEALRLAPILAPRASYTQALSDSVQALDLLARFVGGAAVDEVVTADLASRAARLTPVATDPLALADDVSRKLVIRLVSSEGVDLTSAQALKLLLNPTLAETVTISLAYIAPGDSVTTWAVNARTGATTEYTGYNFNSFAEFGRSYVAASSDGLYELQGDTDDGEDIIAKIKSGLGQFAGSRLTHIKGAYIGARGSGDFLLRIETTDGKTHTYGLTVGSMKTHKVNMGKGIRARYFAYELESTGQDFDLENIKFVPLIAQRRV